MAKYLQFDSWQTSSVEGDPHSSTSNNIGEEFFIQMQFKYQIRIWTFQVKGLLTMSEYLSGFRCHLKIGPFDNYSDLYSIKFTMFMIFQNLKQNELPCNCFCKRQAHCHSHLSSWSGRHWTWMGLHPSWCQGVPCQDCLPHCSYHSCHPKFRYMGTVKKSKEHILIYCYILGLITNWLLESTVGIWIAN